MIIVYTPAGGEPEHFDAKSLLVSEVSIVQRTIDMKWPQIKEGISEDDPEAMRGVAWVFKKRSNPSLRWGDFDPGVDELISKFDKSEIVTYVEETIAIAVGADRTVTGEHLAYALRNLPSAAADPAHAEAFIKEMTDAVGKEADPAAEDAGAREPEDGAQEPSPLRTSTTPEPSISGSSLTSATSLPEESTA